MSKKIVVAPESKTRPISEFNDSEPIDSTSSAHERALARAELRGQFVSLSSQIAESNFYYRNYKYQNADRIYPSTMDAMQRFVTKCFPYAKGGLLLIDEPLTETEYNKALDKQKKLKNLGFRHVIIRESTTLWECLEQLGES